MQNIHIFSRTRLLILVIQHHLSARLYLCACLFHSMVQAMRLLRYAFSQPSIRASLNGNKKLPESMNKTLSQERSRLHGILSLRLMCARR